MRATEEANSSFAGGETQQEEDQGPPTVVDFPSRPRIPPKSDAPNPETVPPDERAGEASDAAPHGIGQEMADPPTREEIEAKLEAVEARTETRFAEMLGEMRSGFSEIRGELKMNNTLLVEEKSGRRVTNTLVIGSALAIAALTVAIFALGGAWFNNGLVVRDTAHDAAKEAIEQYRLTVPPVISPQTK